MSLSVNKGKSDSLTLLNSVWILTFLEVCLLLAKWFETVPEVCVIVHRIEPGTWCLIIASSGTFAVKKWLKKHLNLVPRVVLWSVGERPERIWYDRCRKPASKSIGYAMLMRPNEVETAVHGCLIPARVIFMCACARWLQHLECPPFFAPYFDIIPENAVFKSWWAYFKWEQNRVIALKWRVESVRDG